MYLYPLWASVAICWTAHPSFLGDTVDTIRTSRYPGNFWCAEHVNRHVSWNRSGCSHPFANVQRGNCLLMNSNLKCQKWFSPLIIHHYNLLKGDPFFAFFGFFPFPSVFCAYRFLCMWKVWKAPFSHSNHCSRSASNAWSVRSAFHSVTPWCHRVTFA